MKGIDEIERLLVQTPVPHIVEGPHREQLEKRLLIEAQSILQEKKKRRMSRFGRMSRMLKVAAVILAAALLVGVGWAAEKIYEKLKFTQANVTLEQGTRGQWALPNGKKLTTTTTVISSSVNPDDPKAIEAAKGHYEEMKKLLAQRKFKLLKTVVNELTGGTEYVYIFKFSDGAQDKMNFLMPLETVLSWDEYQRKVQEQEKHYRDQVNKAIAAGRYRLINWDVILIHICLDRDSRKKFKVERISLPKGQEIALYLPYDAAAEAHTTVNPKSSWQEHLQAIRDGTLELLNVETVPNYDYEVTLEDETKRIFNYGGGDPLKRSEAK